MSPDAARLKRARESLHWSQPALARILGVATLTVYSWESGRRGVPEGVADWLEAIALAVRRFLTNHPPPAR